MPLAEVFDSLGALSREELLLKFSRVRPSAPCEAPWLFAGLAAKRAWACSSRCRRSIVPPKDRIDAPTLPSMPGCRYRTSPALRNAVPGLNALRAMLAGAFEFAPALERLAAEGVFSPAPPPRSEERRV